jgi:hypothetical protein
MGEEIYKVITAIAETRTLRIGVFLHQKDNNRLMHTRKRNSIGFENGSTIYMLDGIADVKDCFYASGLEFDLVWIHDSKKMSSDAIMYLCTLARSTKSDLVNRPSIILT